MINLFFQLIHGHRLIYNACWEDPRLDRQLLNLDGDSEVVVITSAGCNALDYLLDGPKAIHAVDVNFRQNALLDLKLAFFRSQPFGELYAFFGHGHSPTYRETYRALRDALSPLSRAFWDRKIDYFSGRGSRRSFYWRGGRRRLCLAAAPVGRGPGAEGRPGAEPPQRPESGRAAALL